MYKAIRRLIQSNLDRRIPESPGDELALIVPATANTGTLRFICTVIYNVINYFLLVIKSKYKQSAFNYWRLQAPNNTQFNHKIDNSPHRIYISVLWSVTHMEGNEYNSYPALDTRHMVQCLNTKGAKISQLWPGKERFLLRLPLFLISLGICPLWPGVQILTSYVQAY